MKREIKFRARETKTKKWLYSEEIGRVAFWQAWFQGELDLETVTEYTGLKDKNGKEIYEGDVVTLGEIDCVHWQGNVEMYNGCWCARVNKKQTPILANFVLEVARNIWKNPELLGSTN